ncbi:MULTISPECIES: hypothetical protein [unclassified Caballeronia]|uniref:hypothetical protein n=1 Tax=unclassified Caballeronia TaxID=2646786 RepID=UPI0028551399|nr:MULTISPECIES: hypothetical protein [unclassified Caballeronia]MDR5752974.1 hypothetical protein [Caballeronia sp. LZ024]MDR5841261.1 hypothetical protein [Caballeronia sp. LZ031]
MRKKNGGFAVVAVLVGVAVAATLLIAGIGRSSKHAQNEAPGFERTAAGAVAASDASQAHADGQTGFALTPQPQAASNEAASVAQRNARASD